VQAAAGEKDRTCAVLVRNTGLFPLVEISLCRDYAVASTAVTLAGGAVGTAHSRAEGAALKNI